MSDIVPTDRPAASSRLGRRSFIGRLGAGAAAAAALGAAGLRQPGGRPLLADESGPQDAGQRRQAAMQMRMDMAQLAFDRPLPDHPANGEEQDYPGIANYSKGLPHDALGQVEPSAYDALLAALDSGDKGDLEALPVGRPLTNPLAGLAFDLEGPDSHHLAMRPAPRIDGPENSSEMAELYWMALLRDVPFASWESSPLVRAAARDLSAFSDFRGPKRGSRVTEQTIFRGDTPGDLAGPYVSQFLLMDIPYGSLRISQRQRTAAPGADFLTDDAAWRAVQDGALPGGLSLDPTLRHIRSLRDLARYVQVDALYEAYLNACLILLGMGAPLDPGNPYGASATQAGFGTFGGPHILSLVTEVATRALKAVWFQKWYVHRRQRPEEFGGRVHNHLTGAASYPIDAEILASEAVMRVHDRYGTYLLPQAYPEGCPTHPAYGSGHATVAGACVTVLKAWFDESFVIPNPVVASADGTALEPYTGHASTRLTVGGELNKVAANIANARNAAGIHWRTDYSEAVRLGEAVALGILEEQHATYREGGAFTLTTFDGETVTI